VTLKSTKLFRKTREASRALRSLSDQGRGFCYADAILSKDLTMREKRRSGFQRHPLVADGIQPHP
jgi:hypothetical protein